MSVIGIQLMNFCGRGRIIEQGADRWWVSCTQQKEHEGPHVGPIAWEDEATFDYEPTLIDTSEGITEEQ